VPGKSAFDALRACLPAGTLSGAPKVPAMEINDGLEPHRPGPYGGAVRLLHLRGHPGPLPPPARGGLKGPQGALPRGGRRT